MAPKVASKARKGRVRAMKNEKGAPSGRTGLANGRPDGKTEDASAGNLDKVRDILFGAQIRDSDRRFARLEERVAQESAEVKEDVRKRLSALEQFVKQELVSLAARLKNEHEARADADKDLSGEVRDAQKANEKRFGQIDDQVGKVQRELRQQLLDTHQKIADDLQRQAQDILTRLSREAAELRHEKLDRAALAAVLTDIAMRVTGELTDDGE
jgi:DNA anti-recombination protein RmuC